MEEPTAPDREELQSAAAPPASSSLAEEASAAVEPVRIPSESEESVRRSGVTVKSEYSVKVRTVNADGTETVTTFDPTASKRVFRLIVLAVLAIPVACGLVLLMIFRH